MKRLRRRPLRSSRGRDGRHGPGLQRGL